MTSYQQPGAFSPLGDGKPPFSRLRRDVGGDQALIWRARSFDEAHSSMETSAERSDENHRDSEGDVSSALHSSFDAALLGSSRVDRSLFGFDDGKQDPQPSWEEDGDPSLGELSGRKHAAETTEVIQPRTIRKKVARRDANIMDTKTPAKPRLIPPGSAMKKCSDDFTPSSAVKRRRAPLPQRKSPMRRVDPLIPSTLPFASSNSFTPKTVRNDGGSFFGAGVASGIGSAKMLQTLTPARSDGPLSTMKSTSRWQNTGTTAGSTHLETTIESDSVDTSSPTTTRFRFTSFPASLPRVNNPRDRHCPDSVRKRMTFGDGGLYEGNCSQSRDDDGTQNTSISSLSDGGQQQTQSASNKPPSVLEWKNRQEVISQNVDHDEGGPVHAQLFPDEENFGYSDSDDDSTASPVLRGIVGRTRLNFNMVLTPPGHDAKEAQKGKEWNAHNSVIFCFFVLNAYFFHFSANQGI
jgi:hypothetical protein